MTLFTKPLIGPKLWNREVERISKSKELKLWKEGCNRKSSLKYYKVKEKPQKESMYEL